MQFHFIVSEDTVTVSMILREDEKPLHLFTVHADKFDFKGFQKEVEFYLYSVKNSSIRTVWIEDQRTVKFKKGERGRLLFATDQEEDHIEKIILDVHEQKKQAKQKELELKRFFKT
jgi:hypothetical protein